MKCTCGQRLIHRSKEDKKVRVRAAAIIFSEDGSTCSVVCPSCKKEIQVPMMLDPRAIPAEPRLVINTNVRLTKDRSSL